VSAHGDQMYGLNLLKWPLKVKMFKTYLVWLLGVLIEGFFVQCVHVINCTVFGQGVYIPQYCYTHVLCLSGSYSSVHCYGFVNSFFTKKWYKCTNCP